MRIEKIDHVAINVKDLDKAAEFFSNLLGTTFTGVKPKYLPKLGGKKFRNIVVGLFLVLIIIGVVVMFVA